MIQQDTGNRHSPTTVIAAISRSMPPKSYPFIVILEPEDSELNERCVVNCAQVATIRQSGPESRLRPPRHEECLRPIGRLDSAKMREVGRALKYNLGLP